MEHPHRADPSFRRPDPLSQQRCKYYAGMTKAQKKKKHISVKLRVVLATGGILTTQLGTSHTALTLAVRACTLPLGCLLCPTHSLET